MAATSRPSYGSNQQTIKRVLCDCCILRGQSRIEINDFYGNFTVFTADTLTGTKTVKQKIPFGGTEYFELLLKRA